MGRKINEDRIKKFHEDRKLLNYMNDVDIAQKLGKSKSSFSNYINGRTPITNNFLKLFYEKFGEEIRSEQEKIGQNVKEQSGSYITLRDQVEALEQKFDQVLQGQQEMRSDLHRIEEKIDRLLLKGRK